MHFLTIHINLAKTWRGGERQVVLLFRELDQMGIRQVLFCKKGSALHQYCVREKINFKSFTTLSSFLVAPFLLLLYRMKGPVIVHCHESKAHTIGVLGRFLSFKQLPVIVHRRVLFPVKQKFTTKFKYSERTIEKVICISKAVEKVIWESIGFSNTVVIPSCVEINRDLKNPLDLREVYNIPENVKLVVYIAALTYEKDHDTFFRVAERLVKQNKKVHFFVIGDGPLRSYLERQTVLLNIDNFVTFTGFLERPERVIPFVDALLFTSISEGLGSTILDFFVYGKPVVSVRNGGAEEIIKDGETGLLSSVGDDVSLASNVLKILGNSDFSKKVTENAYNYVLEYHTPVEVAMRTLQIYREVSQKCFHF